MNFISLPTILSHLSPSNCECADNIDAQIVYKKYLCNIHTEF